VKCLKFHGMQYLAVSLPTQVYFGMLDALLAAEELPEEYRDRYQVLLLSLKYIYLVHAILLSP